MRAAELRSHGQGRDLLQGRKLGTDDALPSYSHHVQRAQIPLVSPCRRPFDQDPGAALAVKIHKAIPVPISPFRQVLSAFGTDEGQNIGIESWLAVEELLGWRRALVVAALDSLVSGLSDRLQKRINRILGTGRVAL